MPSYIVAVKSGLSEEEYSAAQKAIEDKGAKVTHEYEREGVTPGFVVDIPEDTVTTLEENEHVEFVELNSEVKTQGKETSD